MGHGRSRQLLLCVLFAALQACASTEVEEYAVSDPLEEVNRVSYSVMNVLDRWFLRPVTDGYQYVTPDFLQTGFGNFFANLRSVDSAISAFLQFRMRRGLTETGRIVINTTIGAGGLVDVADSMGLEPQREDLGQAFATWGYTRSGYLFMPMIGPTTVRDLPGAVVDRGMPRWLLGSLYGPVLAVLDTIVLRASTLEETRVMEESAVDPYSFIREAYYQDRRSLIFDGDPPMDNGLYDEL